MNILLLCDEYPPGMHGGIGTAVQLLARTLVRQGHRVVVAGFYDWRYGEADHFTDQGVEVYRFRRRLGGSWLKHPRRLPARAGFRLLRITGLLQQDISSGLRRYGAFLEQLIRVHQLEIAEMPDFQDYINYCVRFTPFPRLSIPVIVKLHGSRTYLLREMNLPVPRSVWLSEHQILAQAKAVSSVSAYTARKTAEYLDYPKEITVLYNGLSAIPEPATPVSRQWNQVVFTGALVANKGIFSLLKAWNLVHAGCPEARLQVYGKGPVQKLLGLLDPPAAATVVFHGHVSREVLFKVLQSSGTAVFPSYAECFSLAPMEAMACGAAVIYTSRSSGPELITDGKDGVLVDPDDVAGLASRILWMLQHPEPAGEMAARGQERIRTGFDLEGIARQHIDFYRRFIKSAL